MTRALWAVVLLLSLFSIVFAFGIFDQRFSTEIESNRVSREDYDLLKNNVTFGNDPSTFNEILESDEHSSIEKLAIVEAIYERGFIEYAQAAYDSLSKTNWKSFDGINFYIDLCYKSSLSCSEFGSTYGAADLENLGVDMSLWRENCLKYAVEHQGKLDWEKVKLSLDNGSFQGLDAIWTSLVADFNNLVDEFRSTPGLLLVRKMALYGHFVECTNTKIGEVNSIFFESDSYQIFSEIYSPEIFSAFTSISTWFDEQHAD